MMIQSSPTVSSENNKERRRRTERNTKIAQERKREGKNEPKKLFTVSGLRYIFSIIASDTTPIYAKGTRSYNGQEGNTVPLM